MLDPDSIRAEWRLNPDANVGVLCGPDALDGDGLIIIDIDQPDGWGTIDRLGLHLPDTVVVETPHGGQHQYFRGRAMSWNPGPGVEVRSDGRQCAAPPSVLADGVYDWAHGEPWPWMPVEDAPSWTSVPIPGFGNGTDAPTAPRAPFRSTLRDPVLDVPPPVYFEVLCGLTPDRHGLVYCPIHQEVEASCRVYETAERGWFCFGESCRRGGDVVTLTALLAGIPTPVRGTAFLQLLDYLAERLL
jgi:hypothetical protein